MGRIMLVGRLTARDLRRRRSEVLLLVVAMTAVTMTLTVGLILHGVTDQPYQQTREATSGPDVVGISATNQRGAMTRADLSALTSLINAPGVRGHSGPYPVVFATLRTRHRSALVRAEGRDPEPASLDQPNVTRGRWVAGNGIVVERAFANAFGLRLGQTITLDGRHFRVRGIAVTAALPPYPETCWDGCPPQVTGVPGTIWLTEAAARSLATPTQPLTYTLNLKLDQPDQANAFANPPDSSRPTAPSLESWQELRDQDGNLVKNERLVMLTSAWLLGLLAVATMVVLVGARLSSQLRKVGLMKAVGATPGLISAVFAIEYLAVAAAATAAGLLLGKLIAPALVRPETGLLGQMGGTRLSFTIAASVLAAALAMAVAASSMIVVRSARLSTIRALADSPRPPRRRRMLTLAAASLPTTVLVSLRLIARRPRRMMLATLSIFVAVSGIIAAMVTRSTAGSATGLDAANMSQVNLNLLYVTVLLVVLAAVNVMVVARATVHDSRRFCALQRALGATPNQMAGGLALVQLLPTAIGATAALGAGIGLAAAVTPGTITLPSWPSLLAVVLAILIVVASLIAAPARVEANKPVAELLREPDRV